MIVMISSRCCHSGSLITTVTWEWDQSFSIATDYQIAQIHIHKQRGVKRDNLLVLFPPLDLYAESEFAKCNQFCIERLIRHHTIPESMCQLKNLESVYEYEASEEQVLGGRKKVNWTQKYWMSISVLNRDLFLPDVVTGIFQTPVKITIVPKFLLQ